MLAQNGRLKIALQKKGRMTEDSVELLHAAGLEFDARSNALCSPCINFPLDVLSLRDDDIPEYVQDGVSCLGIVGENIVIEKNADVEIVERLGFGKCRLALCAPKGDGIMSVKDFNNKRIATSYPSTLSSFLKREDISAEIIELSGSVEIAPSLDVADAICDIISTGSTATMNGLKVVATILESEAVLIANKESLIAPGKKEQIERLVGRLRSVLRARRKKYVMMNAPLSSVDRLKSVLPALTSPTIVSLADPNMVAVHSVIGEDVLWEVIERLTQTGASDIIVIPIEKIIP